MIMNIGCGELPRTETSHSAGSAELLPPDAREHLASQVAIRELSAAQRF